MKIKVVKNILTRNEGQAQLNRSLFAKEKTLCINMMSSPGAGKTTLLERTIDELKTVFNIGVIEGDLMTSRDAERINSHGVSVVQINTEGGCHLSADMVYKAMEEFNIKGLDIIIIENVGNLVCPGVFDLGEDFKVVVSSVPEGDDKPLKYPMMFSEAKACILNKVDLIPYTNFNMNSFFNDVYSLNPRIKIFQVSALTGEGMDDWYSWLGDEIAWKTKKQLAK
ncbi:hydrogenase nickel incorporation protein HypB [Desulfitibacter alkalitolerans]|uniref:hydrogenase nickel incorporation protein HypB n=1 Tax=Desulfitibacter alkalitolerans TaxID=264641 RepID=UPI00047FEE9E|nr:hydrogenase nickel incorporation protein HypB [Desulfitibacter alkalitolerans]